MPTTAEIRTMLTGAGAGFEVMTEDVDGRPMQVYKHRMRRLCEVAAAAQARGDEVFLVHGERRFTFAEFVSLANSVSATLAESYGVGHGDRVAVLSQNNPEWCLSFWGTVNLGAILVGLNGWWKADEIVYGLQDSGAKVLVADAKRFERVAGSLSECPDLEAVFIIDADPDEVGGDPIVHRFAVLLSAPSPALPDVAIAEDDDAAIFYTSGTTGRPKGAVSTHRNMIANLQNTFFNVMVSVMTGASMLGGGEGGGGEGGGGEGGGGEGGGGEGGGPTVSLLTSPLFHVSGCHSGLVVGMAAGARLVLPEGRFSPEQALELIERERVTVWAAVPTMVWRVCEYPDRHSYDTSSVTSVAFGGSPSADELQRMVRETFPNVRSTTNAYGLTETSSLAASISGQDAIDKPTSVGPPVPTVEVAIGDFGEILIRGPIVMTRYWNKPEATAEVIDADGWLHTGDIGYLDGDGFLYITDRAKDMIIRGGENVYCVEIENRLVAHPRIADAAVIGVPHPELGEEVKAVVQVEPGSSLTKSEVREWVAATLADFKVPTYVELTSARLPRNAAGKLLKNVLRGHADASPDETL